jgi:hypothetical protein
MATYLSYSGFSKFEACSLAYSYDYIQKVLSSGPDDRLGSVFGSVTGKVFEDFYVHEIWRQDRPIEVLTSRIPSTVDQILEQETTPGKGKPGGALLWKGNGPGQNPKGLYVNKDELIADVYDAVVKGIKIIRKQRLVGRKNGAEVKLDQEINGHKIAGRADFIIERIAPHNDLIILDGKGSRHRDKYLSPKQLMWYALLYRHQFHKIPDKLGFLYWRYDQTPSDPNWEGAIDWVDFSEASLDELLDNIMDDISYIENTRGPFKANPCNESCRFCPYATEELCPKGRQIVVEIERKFSNSKKRSGV